jgi:hypothetical protein
MALQYGQAPKSLRSDGPIRLVTHMTPPRSTRSSTAQPGDGSPLKKYSLTQGLSRTLFFVDLPEPGTRSHAYAVDVHFWADELADRELSQDDFGQPEEADSPVALYRDGIQISRSDLPALFAVPGGHIEVATTLYGLRRMHYLTDRGEERVLRPHPQSAEGLRAAFARRAPRASRAVGWLAAGVLLTGLALTVPQALQAVTDVDLIADNIGTFTSPIHLPVWANTTLFIATTLAAVERALTFRRHWLIDLDTTWSEDD